MFKNGFWVGPALLVSVIALGFLTFSSSQIGLGQSAASTPIAGVFDLNAANQRALSLDLQNSSASAGGNETS